MLKAFVWGLIATSSLVIGGLIGASVAISKKWLGVIMAFGAGVLLSAVAYELVFESIKLAAGSGFPALGFFAGALVFFGSDALIGSLGAANRKSINASHGSNLIVPMILAILLDVVPESLVIGLGMLEAGAVSLAMLIAVFISNLPEAIAGTSGMVSGGWEKKRILGLWSSISLLCAVSAAIGYVGFEHVPASWLGSVLAFAGGAILMMLANTMSPEAYEHGGKLAGVFTVLGFAVSVGVILVERMDQVHKLLSN